MMAYMIYLIRKCKKLDSTKTLLFLRISGKHLGLLFVEVDVKTCLGNFPKTMINLGGPYCRIMAAVFEYL